MCRVYVLVFYKPNGSKVNKFDLCTFFGHLSKLFITQNLRVRAIRKNTKLSFSHNFGTIFVTFFSGSKQHAIQRFFFELSVKKRKRVQIKFKNISKISMPFYKMKQFRTQQKGDNSVNIQVFLLVFIALYIKSRISETIFQLIFSSFSTPIER